ncbi:malto-oligosyltrehalose synthase, partial [Actinotignum sanguinis]|nr:malto-oligosyltrehalose synthase [Actinotignum sanguinis]
IGTWTDNGPIEADRLIDYLRKAAREQKTWTTWTEPDEAVETGLFAYARSVISTPESVAELTAWWEQTRPARRARILAAKVLALTLIGVPDTYQGEEITRNVLVDPDNRRPVNYRCLAGILTQLDSAGALPARASVDEEKMWVTSRLLRLRRERPDTFVSLRSGYEPLAATTGNIFAFTRTLDGEPDVIVLVSRLAHRQELAGGWGDAHIVLPPGRWRNVLEEGEVEGPQLFVRDACATLPVAVYARCEAEDWGGTGTENGAAEYPETGSEESDD